MTVAKHRTPPTREELLDKVATLRPLLQEHAGTADVSRKTSSAVFAGLAEAGLLRLLTPTKFGGFEKDIRTIVDVFEALGEADGAAAWLVGICATLEWTAAHFRDQAQLEVFGPNPDVQFAGSLAPAPAKRIPGGVRVSGRWPFASAASIADWALLGAVVTAEDGVPGPPLLCLAPMSNVQVEDTWHTAGMLATDSNTLLADDLFVPEHRIIQMSNLFQGASDTTGLDHYQLPFVPLGPILLLAPILGIGRATLSHTNLIWLARLSEQVDGCCRKAAKVVTVRVQQQHGTHKCQPGQAIP
jgi:3-hydroxy-9,10-secoandrosta-1,3,5(10)-triene-9,17-dione monooxygenase